MEELTQGKINRIKKEQSFPGGKGVHVALGISELGEECALLGFWGGYTGQSVKQFCEERGILCFGPEVNEPSRICLTFRSSGDLNGTELLEPGPFIDEENLNLFWFEFIRLLDIVSAVCMCGSWPPTTMGMDYSEFIVAAKKKGIRTFVDCSGKSLMNSLSVNPYCIHINNQEGFEILNEHSPLKIADEVLTNCDLAAISCGADGLYLAGKNQPAIHASCKLQSIISAVGCGDSLMAGLIVANKRELNLIDTAKLSVACGSANCIREDLGMFYKKDVDILLAQAEIIPVDHGLSL